MKNALKSTTSLGLSLMLALPNAGLAQSTEAGEPPVCVTSEEDKAVFPCSFEGKVIDNEAALDTAIAEFGGSNAASMVGGGEPATDTAAEAETGAEGSDGTVANEASTEAAAEPDAAATEDTAEAGQIGAAGGTATDGQTDTAASEGGAEADNAAAAETAEPAPAETEAAETAAQSDAAEPAPAESAEAESAAPAPVDAEPQMSEEERTRKALEEAVAAEKQAAEAGEAEAQAAEGDNAAAAEGEADAPQGEADAAAAADEQAAEGDPAAAAEADEAPAESDAAAAAEAEGNGEATDAQTAEDAAAAEAARQAAQQAADAEGEAEAQEAEGTATGEDEAALEAEAQAEQEAREALREERREQRRAERRAAAAAAAAAEEGEAENAETVTEEVTEEDVRSADEEFDTKIQEAEQAAEASAADDDDGLSKFEKALLLGLGAVAVGSVLDNGDKVVNRTGDRLVVEDPNGELRVLKDDDALIRRPGDEVRTQTFDDGSSRSIVTKPDGSQVITIRARDGSVLRRVAVDPQGRQTVLFDDLVEEERDVVVNELPQVNRDATMVSREDENALRAALQAELDVAENQRFSLRQVRDITEVRSLVPQIELDAVRFPTGSAAIQPDQARSLAKIGNTLKELIAEDPRTVILVEGHTDAVGDATYNLALSDRRAETVALALTEYFDVPAQNLITQGYGEKDLKVETQSAEQANRRAVVRNITQLLR